MTDAQDAQEATLIYPGVLLRRAEEGKRLETLHLEGKEFYFFWTAFVTRVVLSNHGGCSPRRCFKTRGAESWLNAAGHILGVKKKKSVCGHFKVRNKLKGALESCFSSPCDDRGYFFLNISCFFIPPSHHPASNRANTARPGLYPSSTMECLPFFNGTMRFTYQIGGVQS